MRLLHLTAVTLSAAVFTTVPSRAIAQMPGMAGMTSASPFNIPMDRMGSGTTWIPDAAPLPSRQFKSGGWDMMLHGYVFAQYDKQFGPRGDDQFGSLNWGMLMASHALAGGRFQARTMLSIDAATVANKGYPLLLQTAETFEGEPIVDRQHPHDFLMELGVLYERAVAGPVGISVYAGPSGEPALGPVAFMHRPSAVENPFAPIGHHWQDATHISFGVVTAGLFGHHWKLEGSAFNGREPDEMRWDVDGITLDSYSGRLTVNPSANWSVATGYGLIKSDAGHHAGGSMRRVTGSVLHSSMIGMRGDRATTFSWGANKHPGTPMTHSLLVESRLSVDRNTVFMRAEHVRKSAAELVVDTPEFGFASGRLFDVSSVSLGLLRDFHRSRGVSLGLGAVGTLNVVPSALDGAYGSRHPAGMMLFLRLRPIGSPTHMMSMPGMNHDGH